jgi:hypothetical protein
VRARGEKENGGKRERADEQPAGDIGAAACAASVISISACIYLLLRLAKPELVDTLLAIIGGALLDDAGTLSRRSRSSS